METQDLKLSGREKEKNLKILDMFRYIFVSRHVQVQCTCHMVYSSQVNIIKTLYIKPWTSLNATNVYNNKI